jgi:Gas vesicle synthesis protein GvpL/GvpF
MSGPASYLYAVGEAALAGAAGLGALRGVDGAPVRAVVEGGLAAVVSPVSRERFGEESLRAAMEDLGWLEDTARAHHGVVDAVAGAGPVAPVRLATVYFGEDNVRALLARQADEFSAVLADLRGRAEWGVKGFAVPPAEPAQAPTAGAGRGPGTSYLMRRQAERDRTTRGQRLAEDAAERAHQQLGRLAVASRRYPPQDPRLSGQRDPMLLNAAYLVPDRSAAAVRDLVDRWRDPHLRLELTGPWAAYSFATVERP